MTTQREIYDKYPSIFKQKDLPMTQTCMCWGLECGSGWFKLIDETCAKIEWVLRAVNSTPQNEGAVEFTQVKEKYGVLTIYWQGYNLSAIENDIVQTIIDYAENRSVNTCEECGEYGCRSKGGWVRTRCDKHHSDYDLGILEEYDKYKNRFFEFGGD